MPLKQCMRKYSVAFRRGRVGINMFRVLRNLLKTYFMGLKGVTQSNEVYIANTINYYSTSGMRNYQCELV